MMRCLKSVTDIDELKRCRSIILRDFLARRDELTALKKSADATAEKIRGNETVLRVFAEALKDYEDRIIELHGPGDPFC
jgi:hypothetical protein